MVAIPFSSGAHFVSTLHHDPSVLGGSTRHDSKFHWAHSFIWTVMSQHIWEPRRNGLVSRNIWSTNTVSRRNRSLDQINHWKSERVYKKQQNQHKQINTNKHTKNKTDSRKPPCKQKTKSSIRLLYWGVRPQNEELGSSQIILKHWRWGNSLKFILLGQHHLDTETIQRQYQNIKLLANIFDKYRYKHSQLNFSKSNPKNRKKNHILWSSWIHSRIARMIQHQSRWYIMCNKRKDKKISIDTERAFGKFSIHLW